MGQREIVMRIKAMVGAVMVVTATLCVSLATTPADAAACKQARCAKQKTTVSKTSGTKTGTSTAALSKTGKKKQYVASRSRMKSTHRKHGAKLADAALRGKRDRIEKPENPHELPPSVANARAELTSGFPQSKMKSSAEDQARNLAATDDNEVVEMNGVQVAASDQLNDMDRAVSEDNKAEAVTEQPKPEIQKTDDGQPAGRIVRAVPKGERHVIENTDGTWSKTSLVGKIFVAFGSILTLVSAARLIIA
jgi:hypothetical protein